MSGAPEFGRPSPFFETHADRVRTTSSQGPALDLACGRGRHAAASARLGCPTLALDIDGERLGSLQTRARAEHLPLRAMRCDLEAGRSIPLKSNTCGSIFVFRFLFRPLSDEIVRTLAPGGLLLYETFTVAQRALGFGPRRDAFLLAPGELPTLFPALEILEFEEGPSAEPQPSHTARLLARRRLNAK